MSVDCVPCRGLLEWIGDASRNRQLVDWDTCVLCAGRPGQVRKLCNDVRLTHEIPVVAVEYAALKQRYQIAGTPTLAIVEEDGRVVDVVVGKAEAYLDVLMRRSTFRIPV